MGVMSDARETFIGAEELQPKEAADTIIHLDKLYGFDILLLRSANNLMGLSQLYF